MALQSSGAIAVSEIKTELSSSSSSLRTLSAAASKSAPDGMQEFYGYSSGPNLRSYSSSIGGAFNSSCHFSGQQASMGQTYHHDGSGTLPAQGDKCYTTAAGTTLLSGANGSNHYTIGGSSGSGNRQYIRIDSSGAVELGYPATC
jgi:hypothetical protein